MTISITNSLETLQYILFIKLLYTRKNTSSSKPGFTSHNATKPGFTSHNVLTIQNVILKNMLIFVNNFFNFPGTLPVFVKHSIAVNIPVPTTTPDNYFDWYSIKLSHDFFLLSQTSFYHKNSPR